MDKKKRDEKTKPSERQVVNYTKIFIAYKTKGKFTEYWQAFKSEKDK